MKFDINACLIGPDARGSSSDSCGGVWHVNRHYERLLEDNWQFAFDPDSPSGQQEYITPGTYSWTAPAGVTSVCVVCVGGGGGGMYYGAGSTTSTFQMNGGGGGGLAWVNDIPVTPGNSYTVVVGDKGLTGAYSAGSTSGGDSYFIDATTCRGGGGRYGRYSQTSTGGTYTASGAYGTSGGGNGGDALNNIGTGPASGGGAGGYSGDGGDGARSAFSPGSGGGGAGGDPSDNNTSGGGGGVGIYGEGASGSTAGAGGSGGGNGNNTKVLGGSNFRGGDFGGGGGGSAADDWGVVGTKTMLDGGTGAVRIIWGLGRAFPSTNTADV